MKRIETKEERIADAIYDGIQRTSGNEGHFNVEVEDGDITIQVDGRFEIDGYTEDDYLNGTGGYVVTSVYVYIEDATEFDQDGNEIIPDTDYNKVQRLVEYRIAA